MNKEQQKIIEETQKALEQMKLDDIEEYGDDAFEEFQCEACGEFKIMAGSVIYKDFRLCNDCSLLAEVCFALNKFDNIDEFLKQMEDKRFEAVYNSIFNVEEN